MEEVLLSFKTEMEHVQSILSKAFKIRAGSLLDLMRMDFSPVKNLARPGLILLAANLYNNVSRQVVYLAAILQFIHTASQIHKIVLENDGLMEKTDYFRDYCQLPVLIGDYLYSQVFVSLCDAGLFNYLRTFSDLIGQINEGCILKLRTDQEGTQPADSYMTVIEKESGRVIAACCRISGELAGAPEDDLHLLESLGFNLGMALGFAEDIPGNSEAAKDFFKNALNCLESLPHGESRKLLMQFIGSLQEGNLYYAK
ncbi:MAG TPA: hypothetical protein DCK76_11455 [Desulfotomaculum sp.]|nr:MAG: hypothetical protein XD84_0136 [Desulfotomaculum sp. 46_80]HAG11961.1 hypothetical protein [Desulfotomaculum sp.]HBY04743.1 hypothetical protein [Desulfotomaculum sp.]